jgi:hypothetical protein
MIQMDCLVLEGRLQRQQQQHHHDGMVLLHLKQKPSVERFRVRTYV